MKETVLMRVNDDNEPVVTPEGAAMFFGISVEEVRSYGTEGKDMTGYPPELIQAGQRRTREAAAAIGENDLMRILCYWANQSSESAEVLIVMREAGTPTTP